MKDTFVDLIREVKKLVRPLGFRIETSSLKPELVIAGWKTEKSELRITIVATQENTKKALGQDTAAQKRARKIA